MDLRARIRRAAAARPAVLLAACPGATGARLRLERELRERGWPVAAGPASANVLAVVGDPDPAGPRWCDGLWAAVPAPRARVHIRAGEHPGPALDGVVTALVRDPLGSRTVSPAPSPLTPPRPGQIDGQAGHGTEEGHGADSGRDGEHTGHGTGTEVAGLPMADRGGDRDGLSLDRLHLPLGPALPDWPAGLVLRLTLQGDLVQQVRVEHMPVLTDSRPPFWDEPWLRAASGHRVTRGQAARRLCAAHLDSLGRLLAVAGWHTEAERARTARDGALAGLPAAEVGAAVQPLVRRVSRSRTLRRLTVGLGGLSAEAAAQARVSGPALVAGGDVWSRLTVWLEEAARSAALSDRTDPLDAAQRLTGPRGALDAASPPSRALLDVLPGLLDGVEFAAARLVVASLDPDPDELVLPAMPREPHG
ncbi:hypothetical protein [Streptomyces griseus]|uniref:hypothetical protein n=1 Tax=Streptomyces griseus TaxID=1911 RepID=UPI00084011E8|nr:hypothetical protein [Streptomyces griseus]